MLNREEKQMALDSRKEAQMEAEMAQLAEARLGLMNKGEPTTTDKIVSALPYLLPLLEMASSLEDFICLRNTRTIQPVVGILGLLHTVYMYA